MKRPEPLLEKIKAVPVFIIMLLLSTVTFANVYTFTGNGNWSVQQNWSNGIIPPTTLPAGDTILISPQPGDSCVLDISQVLSSGAVFTVAPGAKFIIKGSLATVPSITIIAPFTPTGCTYTIGAQIINDGGSLVTERGFVVSTSHNPTVNDKKVISNAVTGTFYNDITDLIALTTYYVRAYAVNSAGIAYSNEISFTTTPYWYALNTYSIVSTASTSAQVMGLIDGNWFCPEAIKDLGMVWSTSPNPTAALSTKTTNDTLINQGSSSIYISNITGLQPNTSYYVRAYIITILGDTQYAYQENFNFTTTKVTTSPISAITFHSAASGGSSIYQGGTPITSKGIVWSTSPNPTTSLSTKTNDGNGTGDFASTIEGLQQNTTYYVRAYIISNLTEYGNEISFTTTKSQTLTTDSLKSITTNSATGGGNVTSDGGSPVTERGIIWSTTHNPTTDLSTKIISGSGTGNFVTQITGLFPNTTYYVRAYAINGIATIYGNEIGFTTVNPDIPYITSPCNQTWMLKNLDVVTYRNGDTIPQVTSNSQWTALKTGAWCYYQNILDNDTVYGKLYNWHAVNDPRGLAPEGWHIPTAAEWIAFRDCIGNNAAGNMKEAGTLHWISPNSGATNSSGFTALPGGSRNASIYGGFQNIGAGGLWWTSNAVIGSTTQSRFVTLWYNDLFLNTDSLPKTDGLSVRCVKNP